MNFVAIYQKFACGVDGNPKKSNIFALSNEICNEY